MKNKLNELLKLNKKQLGALVLAFTMAGSLSACKKNNKTVNMPK